MAANNHMNPLSKGYLAFCLTALWLWAGLLPAQTGHIVGSVRVQPLSPTLVRLELKGPNGFEDRPSFHIMQRQWPGVAARRETDGGRIRITTDYYHVTIPQNANSLNNIVITDSAGQELWAMTSQSSNITIKCRWTDRGNAYFYDAGDHLAYGANPDNPSYYWTLKTNGDYTRIVNKATGHYLNLQGNNDYVQCTEIQPDWISADWVLETVDGYRRFRNRLSDRPDYLHIENLTGFVQHAPPSATNSGGTPISGWWSAMWSVGNTESDLLSNNRYWLPIPPLKHCPGPSPIPPATSRLPGATISIRRAQPIMAGI